MSAAADSPLIGTWVAAEPGTESVKRLSISRRGEGFFVAAAGGFSGGTEPVETEPWGEVPATAFAIEPDARLGAMVAKYDFGALETTLTFFLKSEILILDTFNDLRDRGGPAERRESAAPGGDRRASYFTREFLYRRRWTAEEPPLERRSLRSDGATRGKDLLPPGASVSPLDPSTLLGTWRSCDAETRGIREIVIAGAGSDLTMRAFAEGGALDLGQVRCDAYAEGVLGGRAGGCKALFDLPSKSVLLAAYLNKGLLGVDAFHQGKDGSPLVPHRVRDHFFRARDKG